MDSASTALTEEERKFNWFLLVVVIVHMQQIHDVDVQWMRSLTDRLF